MTDKAPTPPDASPPPAATSPATTPAAAQPTSPQKDGAAASPVGWGAWFKGMAQGAAKGMKGFFGLEDLQVEKSGAKEEKEQWTEEQKTSLWSKLSKLIGADITSMISLPVWAFEPMSFLQIMAEPFEHTSLFDRASETQDPYERIALIAAFTCAVYSRAVRPKKPFNPILGETTELVPRKREPTFKFLAEQVSHHPPISVGHATSAKWSVTLETLLKSKFGGNSSEVFLIGTNHFVDKATGDRISWDQSTMTTCAHNILIGSLWIDHYGTCKFTDHGKNCTAVLRYTKCGWSGAGRYVVEGEVMNDKGAVVMKLNGKWNERLTATRCDPTTGQPLPDAKPIVLWETIEEKLDPKWLYGQFVHQELIDLSPEYIATLPQTDSRVRTDRRLVQEQKLDLAGPEKHRLEEKQRAEERARKAKQEEWVPRYFHKVPNEQFSYLWEPVGEVYWQEREARIAQAAAAATASTSSEQTVGTDAAGTAPAPVTCLPAEPPKADLLSFDSPVAPPAAPSTDTSTPQPDVK